MAVSRIISANVCNVSVAYAGPARSPRVGAPEGVGAADSRASACQLCGTRIGIATDGPFEVVSARHTAAARARVARVRSATLLAGRRGPVEARRHNTLVAACRSLGVVAEMRANETAGSRHTPDCGAVSAGHDRCSALVAGQRGRRFGKEVFNDHGGGEQGSAVSCRDVGSRRAPSPVQAASRLVAAAARRGSS